MHQLSKDFAIMLVNGIRHGLPCLGLLKIRDTRLELVALRKFLIGVNTFGNGESKATFCKPLVIINLALRRDAFFTRTDAGHRRHREPVIQANLTNIEWIGQALFTRFMLPFEVAAVILTVAIVVAVMLTLRRRVGTKTQDPARQVVVRREDRVRLVKMKAEDNSGKVRPEGNP